jgi:hypothetical protein
MPTWGAEGRGKRIAALAPTDLATEESKVSWREGVFKSCLKFHLSISKWRIFRVAPSSFCYVGSLHLCHPLYLMLFNHIDADLNAVLTAFPPSKADTLLK